MEGCLQKAFPMLHQAAGHGGKCRRMVALVLPHCEEILLSTGLPLFLKQALPLE
jgi:hypothetical protein